MYCSYRKFGCNSEGEGYRKALWFGTEGCDLVSALVLADNGEGAKCWNDIFSESSRPDILP